MFKRPVIKKQRSSSQQRYWGSFRTKKFKSDKEFPVTQDVIFLKL